ncbi:MAG: hypothetical protein DI535_00445 [Citrobacter freundii]|nr:MAG: hypothetical protein DI535_00445 [Citrobacter freundii]
MTPEAYNWYINLVKDRYHQLDLSFEQAEKIYHYQEEKDIYSDKHFFSVWEEWDYERTVFREILNDDQFEKYDKVLQHQIKRYEQSLAAEDVERTNEILYHEEMINFYEQDFLPELFKDPFIRYGWSVLEKNKVDYLRNEYQRFLRNLKKELLTNHFRQNRTFKPTEFKLSLLRHKLHTLFPDYQYFKNQMDEPTRTIADYLKTKARNLPDETEKLLAKKFNELREFNDRNFKKHYGDKRSEGWHVEFVQFTPEEERENRSMTLLLLDREK